MSDSFPSDAAPAGDPRPTLPTFTPVPRLKERSNGWAPETQRAFIEALADTGSVKAAAHAVGRSERNAYELRRHPAGSEFREAWAAALDIGIQRVEDVAMERALNGVEVPVYSYGKLIGTRRVYNDRLLMFMLRNRAPARFAANGGKGLDAVRLQRLKQQWRKEWEEEMRAKRAADSEKTLLAIDRKLEQMQQRRLAAMSKRTRALHDAYHKALEEEDWRGPDATSPEPALPSPAKTDGVPTLDESRAAIARAIAARGRICAEGESPP